MSLRFRILFSSACAVLAVLLCVASANAAREEAERERNEALARYGGEVVGLVVADEGLEAGDVITSSNVSERDWVSDLAPADALTSLDDVLGRQLTVPIAEGAPLTSLNFREDTETVEVPSGHVAVSVPITDKLGLGSNVPVGARVVAYRVTDSASELLAGDATVISSPGTEGSTTRGSLTVALLPDDVSAVLGASASGDLRLVQPADDVAEMGEGDVSAPEEVTPEQEEVTPEQEEVMPGQG